MEARKTLFLVAVLGVLIVCGPAWASDLTDGLVAHWKFDDGGGTIATDSVGSNDGTLVNGPIWTTGQINGGLCFSGGEDYVDCGSSFASVTGSTTKTIMAWAKSDVSDRSGRIITLYRRSDSYSAFVIYPRENDGDNPATWKGLYAMPGNGHKLIDSGVLVTADEWVHVALVQNGADVHIYVDGELENSTSDAAAPVISNPPHAVIGTYMWYGHGPSASFLGTIDDARIYDRALSSEEIQQLYQEGSLDLVGLEITGPDEVAEDSQVQYKAIAHYDIGSTKDITDSAAWSVDPNNNASITAGLLQTETIDLPQDITITAQYSEGDVNESAEKQVSLLTICPSGSALQFDGVDDCVVVNDNHMLSPKRITISAWIYPKDISHNFQIVGKWRLNHDPDEYHFDNYNNNDALRFGAWIGGLWREIWSDDAVLTANVWQHVAVTWDGSTCTFYVNGQSAGDNSNYLGCLSDSDSPVYIGRLYDWGGGGPRPFGGNIDEVTIYNRALSAEEIQLLMHTRPDVDDPNLVGYWNFDEGEGQVAGDMSGNGNDGTLGSTPDIDNSDPNWIDSDVPVGICTLDGLVGRNISNVLDIKAEILDLLDIALGKEDALLDYMDDAFHNGEFDNLNKGDVVKAKQKIMGAIQQEEQAETAVGQSIEKLDDALKALDIEVDTDGESQE